MSEFCPVHCVNIGCPIPSFLENNQAFLLTVIGIGGSGLTVLLSYCLKSRCQKIKVCYGLFSCDRDISDLPVKDTTIDVEVGDSPSVSSLNQ